MHILSWFFGQEDFEHKMNTAGFVDRTHLQVEWPTFTARVK